MPAPSCSTYCVFLLGFVLGTTLSLLLLSDQYQLANYLSKKYEQPIQNRYWQSRIGAIEATTNNAELITDTTENLNTTLAQEISKRVRVLCWILTGPQFHKTRAIHIQSTWGKRCDKILFMSSGNDTELPIVNLGVAEGRNHLWEKTKKAFIHIHKYHINDYDWFLKADDDTYVIMENLKYMLMSKDPNVPINYGWEFHERYRSGVGVLSGGAGYVLSRAAVDLFVTRALRSGRKCRRRHNSGSEDVEIARCLADVNVLRGDSRDQSGKQRFLPISLNAALEQPTERWFIHHSKYPFTKDYISNLTIAIHYANAGMLHTLEHLLYNMEVYGANTHIRNTFEAETILGAAWESSRTNMGAEEPETSSTTRYI